MIFAVDGREAIEQWDRIEPLLNRILLEGDVGYDADDVLTAVQRCDLQLWQVNDYQAVAVTEVYRTPKWSAVNVFLLAGDGMHEWFDDLMDVIEDFARAHGCKYVEARGRRGWVRVAAHRGYEEVVTVVRKQLDE